ncbi:polyvinyl alcohol dehydrogenase (cytochrome) [Bradyrhizobium sp. GM5.1]
MRPSVVAVAMLVWCCAPALAQQDGAALYASHCAQCHDGGDGQSRVPGRGAMQAMSFDHVLGTLTSGSMAAMAKDRSDSERRAIAAFVTGKAAVGDNAVDAEGRCTQQVNFFPQALDGPRWNGWGVDVANSRFQSAEMAGLTAEEVPRLRLKWAYAFPGASVSFAPPTIVGGLLFIGGTDRKVHALDARSGCTRWTLPTDAAVRAAISFGPLPGTDQFAIFFGDLRANAYAVNALTGALIWKTKVEEHPAARITGAPTLHSGVLYIPVSSLEEAAGSQASYECCTFRGSVVALEAVTGKPVWQAYTIPEVPHPTGKNARGTQLFGPSGAAVWSAPTIDPKRNAVYVATSNSYSNPPAATADAVLAFELATGKLLWKQQATPSDAFIVACFGADKTNCPEDHGPDHDFGQSPILVTLRDGRRVLAIAQKSGVVHALDPDDGGKILWQTRIGKGGALGGSEWGFGRRPGSHLCRELRRAVPARWYAAARCHPRRRPVRPRPRQWENCDGSISCRLWRSPPMQPCAVGCREPDPRRRVFRRRQRLSARLRDSRRKAVVGIRHGARLYGGERRPWSWRRDRRPRADHRRRNALHQFRLRPVGRRRRQRTAGVRGCEGVRVRPGLLCAPAERQKPVSQLRRKELR